MSTTPVEREFEDLSPVQSELEDSTVGTKNARLQARVFSVGMALSAASWAVLGVVNSPSEDRFTIVRMCLSALHCTTAVLFALRVPAKAEGSPLDIMAALPSLILSGALYRLAPVPSVWPLAASFMFAGGTVFTIASLATLGRSFAFLPSRRTLVTRGPYAIVRHPAYLGELVMTGACATTGVLAGSLWLSAGLFAVVLPAVVWRILAEDGVLGVDDEWDAYAKRTPARLIPFIW